VCKKIQRKCWMDATNARERKDLQLIHQGGAQWTPPKLAELGLPGGTKDLEAMIELTKAAS